MLRITNAPKPTTNHCIACGSIFRPSTSVGGRGEKRWVTPVMIQQTRKMTARPIRLTAHCRAGALRLHSESQLMPGVTEARTAPLALNGCGSSGETIPSTSPRFGSRKREIAQASSSPGTAATRKANCQPEKPPGRPGKWLSHHPATTPPNVIDRPRPSAVAMPIAAIAVPRRARGKVSKMIELAAGCADASPTPTPRRETASSVKPPAKAESPQKIDQAKMQIHSSFVLIQPSTKRPSGSENSA